MRLARTDAKRIAREFKRNSIRQLWILLEDKNVVVDALVMDQIRNGWMADSTKAHTAEEIVEFRNMLVEELAAAGWKERP